MKYIFTEPGDWSVGIQDRRIEVDDGAIYDPQDEHDQELMLEFTEEFEKFMSGVWTDGKIRLQIIENDDGSVVYRTREELWEPEENEKYIGWDPEK